MSKLVSIVIPVYNNQETLEGACRQIMELHQERFAHLGLEILFVNDAATDNSWKVMQQLQEAHPKTVSILSLSRNFGQIGALYAGFNHAKGDAILCISADLQDPISLIPEMVKHWEQGIEIVICHRQKREDSFLARQFSKFAYTIVRMSYPQLPRGGFDYWLMSRRVSQAMCSFKGRHNFIQGYLLSVGFSKVFIPYTRVERKHGKSGFKLPYKIKIIIDFLVNASYLPIRAMSVFGAITAFSGVIYSLFITYAWLYGNTPFAGWAPLMIMLMIIGGLIMIMLGIIGEYIWRIHDNIKDFPLFIVDKEISDVPSPVKS